jgi:hypothetical protein
MVREEASNRKLQFSSYLFKPLLKIPIALQLPFKFCYGGVYCRIFKTTGELTHFLSVASRHIAVLEFGTRVLG